MNRKIMLNKFALIPTRAHKNDAELDLRTPHDIVIPSGGSALINTGVHIEIKENEVGLIKSKSGLNTRFGIITEGVIDTGYTGSIFVKLYNLGNETAQFKTGDKIAQLLIMPVIIPQELEVVNSLPKSERGNNGFGSSGRWKIY